MASASTPSQHGDPDVARSRPRTAAGGFADDFGLTVHRLASALPHPCVTVAIAGAAAISPTPSPSRQHNTSPERLEHQGHALVGDPQPVITRENAAQIGARSASQTSGGAAGDAECAHSATRSRESAPLLKEIT